MVLSSLEGSGKFSTYDAQKGVRLMGKKVNFVFRITFAVLFGIFVAQYYAGGNYSSSDREALDLLVEQLLRESEQSKNPTPEVRKFDISISDGKFDELSKKWRDGVHWLLSTGKCKAYDNIVWYMVGGNKFKYLLAKAQMMVESGCRFDVIGGGTDHGLFQVQRRTCEDVGIKVDAEEELLDPKTNVKCAIAYHKKLCVSYGKCTLTDMLVSYNVGPTGSSKVIDKRAHQYPRKIEYALRELLKRKIRFSGV
jgi:hypothetical protein